MNRSIFLILISLLIIVGSCSSRRSKLDRHGLIPEKKLVSILVDVHIADGLLSLPKISNWCSSLDSISTYSKIIEKYGYSKEAMDKTMKYYFVKKPKKLIAIYDQVLGILSEKELLMEEEKSLTEKNLGLWKGEEFYTFPELTETDSTCFDVTLNKSVIYVLSFTATLFPDDQSVNPQITVYSCHPDSAETGIRNYIEPSYYIKDGYPHIYHIRLYDPINNHIRFRGRLYDYENHPEDCYKHAIFENISITYSSAVK